jgi:2,3-bisphosphoglycerate-independent phosphoglycerate mutase
MPSPKVLTIILDGWGLNKAYEGNAIYLAKTPYFDELWHSRPRAILHASGEWVGLPDGQMGTSEVNHLTIGAGRVAFQDLVRINKAIEEKSFEDNPAFVQAFEHVKAHNSVLHLKGLLSPGGVHSHQDHVVALLKAAKKHGVKKVYLHVFTDGRDVLPKSAGHYLGWLEKQLGEIGLGKIATIGGRYYAMDRDHNWERTDKAFMVLTGKQAKKYKTVQEALEQAYNEGETDEFVSPRQIEVGPGEDGFIASNDAVIFVNFRNDRTRQLTERFIEKGPENVHFVTMTRYHPDYDVNIAYPPIEITKPIGGILAGAGLKQLRITETEKFAHLTFFLNCKREEAYEGEDRIMLDSYSDIKTHDERPEMRTPDIAREIVANIESGIHEVIFANLCNADMVGHTGNIPAAIKGCEAVDEALSRIVPVALKHGYDVIVTADHGNSDEMIDERSGEILTSHSLNPVPFIVVSNRFDLLKKDEGSLIDVAPTMLKMLNLKIPKEMTGTSFV